MSFTNLIIKRGITTTAVREGKRNFKKFSLYNKRGTRIFKKQQSQNPDPDVPIQKRGVRDVGYTLDGKFITVPEMIPELIVPDLKGFNLKPYVSYKAPDVIQSEFTAQDLFNVVYAEKISKDFQENKLTEKGDSQEPSNEEKMTSEEARIKSRQTGSDIF
ncbi:large ribosomal subunit protein mL41 [Onthophagus taurus]|uniref:large ribosomal subunit protein mL41 n=1 Tax=Onthophagus taurus TaxID=166361 RepID=UPI000C20D9BA|nr:39S ribosomal protein L41, mitochondrial isoform X2 [Onthophagus taurus]